MHAFLNISLEIKQSSKYYPKGGKKEKKGREWHILQAQGGCGSRKAAAQRRPAARQEESMCIGKELHGGQE